MLFRLLSIAMTVTVSGFPGHAFAQNPSFIPASGMIGNCSFVTGDFHFSCLPLYLAYLIQLVFGFAGGIALMELIKGGYEVAWNAGLGTNKEAGKNRIRNALLGFTVVILAYTIVDLIISLVIS